MPFTPLPDTMGVGGIAIQGTGGIVGIADPLDVMSYADYVYIYIYTYTCLHLCTELEWAPCTSALKSKDLPRIVLPLQQIHTTQVRSLPRIFSCSSGFTSRHMSSAHVVIIFWQSPAVAHYLLRLAHWNKSSDSVRLRSCECPFLQLTIQVAKLCGQLINPNLSCVMLGQNFMTLQTLR